MLGLIIIAASLVYAFGLLVGDKRHAWVLFGVMLALLIGTFSLAWWAESQPNPVVSNIQPLLEGKEATVWRDEQCAFWRSHDRNILWRGQRDA